MSEHLAGLEAHEGETDPREDKPHRVRKRKAARGDRHKDCNAKQADRVGESNIHDADIAACEGFNATTPFDLGLSARPDTRPGEVCVAAPSSFDSVPLRRLG